MRVLVVGYGYVGAALAQDLAQRGHSVDALRRSARGDTPAADVNILRADIAEPSELGAIGKDYDWVVDCVAPGAGDADSYERVYLHGMRNLVAHFKESGIQKLVYTSSTAVYAQDDGSLVDETSPAEPASPTGKILRGTEEVLLGAFHDSGFPGVVLRASGIYGPGRTYWLKMFLAGEADPQLAEARYMNMIHRDDLVGAIACALERGRPGEIYNATDDEPVTQQKVLAWVAANTSSRTPARAPTGVSPAGRRRGATNKRISNRKLREELDYRFIFPTFREGYAEELKRVE
jgi:nucleoside-diphosphate-sugar epimerase